MKVKDLLEQLKNVDPETEVVSPFVVVGKETRSGYASVKGFTQVTVKPKDKYFVDDSSGQVVACIGKGEI